MSTLPRSPSSSSLGDLSHGELSNGQSEAEVERFHLNPFSMVTETESGFIINNSIDHSARFSKNRRDIIDALISGRSFTYEEITRFIAPTRLKELESKRIILRGNTPPLTGRYSRQVGFLSLMSSDFDGLQQRLRAAHVLVLGAGAIGSHVVWNLAAMGIGKLTLVDFDRVEESNLNRQLMYTPRDIGDLKVEVLARKIAEFNPTIEVVGVNSKIESAADIRSLLNGVDMVVKAIDTPEEASIWLNEVCVEAATPYVQGGFIDRTAVIGPNYLPDSNGCFACTGTGSPIRRLFGTGPTFAPLATQVSSLLSMIIFRTLTGRAEGLGNKIVAFDLERFSWQSVDLRPERDCSICGATQAEERAPDTGSGAARWIQRGSYTLLLSLIVLLRGVLDQPAITLIGLLATFLMIPVVQQVERDNAGGIRRELFIFAAIYVFVSVTGALIATGIRESLSLPGSVDEWALMVRTVCSQFLQAVIGLTVLFYLMTGAERNIFARLDPNLRTSP